MPFKASRATPTSRVARGDGGDDDDDGGDDDDDEDDDDDDDDDDDGDDGDASPSSSCPCAHTHGDEPLGLGHLSRQPFESSGPQ
jgi:hypothetical protein